MIKRKRHIVQHSRIRKEKVRQISNLHQCKVIFAMVSTRDTYPNFTHVGWKRATWHTNIIFSSSVHINMAWFQASSIITIPSALSSTHSSQHNQTEVIFLQKKNIMYETKKKTRKSYAENMNSHILGKNLFFIKILQHIHHKMKLSSSTFLPSFPTLSKINSQRHENKKHNDLLPRGGVITITQLE